MATWRCPHCGTPQADGSRCWVCSKSPTTCSTCRHFRNGVVQGVGYCALDRSRAPLRGEEVRACWQAPAAPEPARGLFAMVEELEASQPSEPGADQTGGSAPGISLLRRLAPQRHEPDAGDAPQPPQPEDAAAAAAGRLSEATTVGPSLRLGWGGDARSQREAAESRPS